jgi:O-antigen/teichoic acid export membrane protein
MGSVMGRAIRRGGVDGPSRDRRAATADVRGDDVESEPHAEVVGLARGSALNLVGAVFNQTALLLISLVVARRLGRAGVGVYSQAFAFLALLSLLSLSGLRAGLTRFVAVHRADGDAAALRGTLRLGLLLSTAAGTVLGVGLFVAASWLAKTAFDDPSLVTPLRYVALALPAAVFTEAALSATQGFKTMRYFAGVGMIVEPGLRTTLTVGVLVLGGGIRGVMAALLVSNVVAAVLAALALRRLAGPQTAPPRYDLRQLFRFSFVSWASSLAATGLIWADIIILGALRPSAEVGVYQIATRVVMLATLAMWPVNSAFAPRIADLYRRGRGDSLQRTYAAATSWILRLSLPAFVLLLVFPHEVLRLFGPAFGGGAAVAVILVLGKLTDAATGPCGLMLNMSGRVALNMADNVVVLVANIGLNLWLIPIYGIEGAALAWTGALVLVNVARVLQVSSTMGMLPFDTSSAKGLLAALVAVGGGVAVDAVLGGTPALAVGAVVVALGYLAALVALGVPADDRLVLRGLVRRARPQPALRG